jgi:hypothetical protein
MSYRRFSLKTRLIDIAAAVVIHILAGLKENLPFVSNTSKTITKDNKEAEIRDIAWFTENKPPDPNQGSPASSGINPGWYIPQPETLPRPTYWPMFLALGIVFSLLGIVTTLIVSGVGFVLFALAIAGWIGELRHE